MTISDEAQSRLFTPDFVELDSESRCHLGKDGSAALHWFTTHAQDVLRSGPSNWPHEQVEVLLRFVLWHYKEGQYETGLEFALRAVQISRDAGLTALLRRALNLLALICSRLGSVADATVWYIESLRIAEEIGDRGGKASTLANLAELRMNAGLVIESIDLNRYVLQLVHDDPQYFQIATAAHHNIAVACLLLGDLDTAEKEIDEAKVWESYPTNDFFQYQCVVADATECKILVAKNKIFEARVSAERAMMRASSTSSRSALINASLVGALCDAAEGDTKHALHVLESIRTRLQADEPLYQDFLQIEAVCNFHAGNAAEADYLSKRYLTRLAAFQRRAVIRQVATIQRTIRVLSVSGLQLASGCVNPISTRSGPGSAVIEQLESLATLADQRDGGEGHHNHRVGKLVELLAAYVGYEPGEAARLGTAARFHDIGKLAIPDVLLFKRAALTSIELDVIRRHTVEGSLILMDILATIERSVHDGGAEDLLRTAAEICLNHHEHWDGSGYPREIEGVAIPEPARIVAIADTFEDLIAAKPYRTPKSVDDALTTMRSQAGKQFDPHLLTSFATLIDQLRLEHGRAFDHFAPERDDMSVYQRACLVIDRIALSAKQFQGNQAPWCRARPDYVERGLQHSAA